MSGRHDRGLSRRIGARRGLVVPLFVAAPVLTACAFGSVASTAEATQIVFTGAGFEPATVTVDAGTEIRLHNGATAGLTVTLLEAEAAEPGVVNPSWSTPVLAQGETFNHRLETPGSYVYGTDQPAGQTVAVVHVEGP